jgi:hypothetical protein
MDTEHFIADHSMVALTKESLDPPLHLVTRSDIFSRERHFNVLLRLRQVACYLSPSKCCSRIGRAEVTLLVYS